MTNGKSLQAQRKTVSVKKKKKHQNKKTRKAFVGRKVAQLEWKCGVSAIGEGGDNEKGFDGGETAGGLGIHPSAHNHCNNVIVHCPLGGACSPIPGS